MKKLKLLLGSVACGLLVFTAIGGTMADKGADNQNLNIVQTILQRNGNALVEFVQDQELIPAVYSELTRSDVELQDDTTSVSVTVPLYSDDVQNVIDKLVFVTNNGNVAGYIRTWFAFELGDMSVAEFEKAVILNRNETAWTWSDFQKVTIDGFSYAVGYAEYIAGGGRLAAGETAAPSLLQVLLDSSVTHTEAQRLDGNGNGKYEIRVFSRAVSDQDAWGSGSIPSHPWEGATGEGGAEN